MFKAMRRSDRQAGAEDIEKILAEGEYGVLSVTGDNGYAYGVPLNYAYQDKTIYIHSATEGFKLQSMEKNNKVSFCVVTDVKLLPDQFATNFKSVIAFGTASEADADEKAKALLMLIEKYSADFMEEGKKYIEDAGPQARVFKIEIDHVTGKVRNT